MEVRYACFETEDSTAVGGWVESPRTRGSKALRVEQRVRAVPVVPPPPAGIFEAHVLIEDDRAVVVDAHLEMADLDLLGAEPLEARGDESARQAPAPLRGGHPHAQDLGLAA